MILQTCQKKKEVFSLLQAEYIYLFFIGFISQAAVDLIPKILFEMLPVVQKNSLTKALVEQHAAEINAVDVMRYSAQKIS